MDAFNICDCQIDARYAWRPDFDDNIARLRIAAFEDRLVVTAFDDASEGVTQARTVLSGAPTTPWRDVVAAVLSDENFVTFNEDWPSSPSIVSPTDLEFSTKPNCALKMIALAWLGAEWTNAAQFLLQYSDAEISKLDEEQNLLTLVECTSSETAAACLEDEDLWPKDYFVARLTAAVLGKPFEKASLEAEPEWQEDAREEALAPFRESIDGFVERWSVDNYPLSGGNLLMGHGMRRGSIKRYIEEYCLKNRSMPTGQHEIEWNGPTTKVMVEFPE